MKYEGTVKKVEIKKNNPQKHIDWIKLVVWYIGVLISFIPIGIEAIVYMGAHSSLDVCFWIKICTKGDVLWIFATLLILTLVECFSGSIELKSKMKIWLELMAIIVWGISLVVWSILKFVYPHEYSGNLTFWLCGIIGTITLILCTTLQGQYVEVKE